MAKKDNPWKSSMQKMGKEIPKCPVCGGSGNVKAGMFDITLGAKESLKIVVCKKCKGKGYLDGG